MIEPFINFVIRPPRAAYDPDQYLWETNFTLSGRPFKRQDLELTNGRNQILRCSHYVPSLVQEDLPLPCVIYCHGNSGSRADANEAAVVLLPSNITVFTLDFSGSGLSDGNYVSLGWHEKDDLSVVVSYLRSNKCVSHIGLWGRSMGAVTSLFYASEDPSICGMVLDSAFSNLFDLMMELVDVYKIRFPKFTVKVALQYMRRVIQKRAKFDIMDLNCMQVARKTYVPALFAHANGDKFVQPHHSDAIFKIFAGDKRIVKFDGDHNSSRPQFYYDTVSMFFYNILCPPGIACGNMIEKGQSLEFLKVSPCVDADKIDGAVEEYCSHSSSNRGSWGRCSSLDGSDSAEDPAANSSQQMSPDIGAAIGHVGKSPEVEKKTESKKQAPAGEKKRIREKFVKLGALGQRLRVCILKRVNSRN